LGALAELTGYVEEAVRNIDRLLSERRAEEVVEDYFYLNALLYILQTSIQALIDMAYRLLSKMGSRPPSSYGEAPRILHKLGMLNAANADRLRRMIGLRNVLVHRYLELDRELVLTILRERRYRELLAIAHELLKRAAERGIDP